LKGVGEVSAVKDQTSVAIGEKLYVATFEFEGQTFMDLETLSPDICTTFELAHFATTKEYRYAAFTIVPAKLDPIMPTKE
jgi:hypothetical protein